MDLSCGMKCMKALLFVFNSIFTLVGLGIVALGVFINVKKSRFVDLIGENAAGSASYVIIGVGALILLISLAGCIGAIKLSSKLLIVYFSLMLIIFLVEAAVAVLAYMFHDKGNLKPLADEYVEKSMLTLYRKPGKKIVWLAIDWLQIELKCCGYNDTTDWQRSWFYTDNSTATVLARNGTVFPHSCCKTLGCDATVYDSDLIQAKPCRSAVIEFVQDHLTIIGAAALAVAIIQIIGMIFALCLCHAIKSADHVMAF